MKILYYEDDSTLNTSITEKLEQEGYEVYAALTLADSMEWLNKYNIPDLALLDIKESPRYDPITKKHIPEDPEAGFKIADRIKQINRNIPIVFLTGYDKEKAVLERARKYAPIEIFGKGKQDAHKLDEAITKDLLDKINIVLDAERKTHPLEEYFSSAFGWKISIELKAPLSESWFQVVDLDEIMKIENMNVVERDFIDLNTENEETELLKLLYKELKDIVRLHPVDVEELHLIDKLKWLPPTDEERSIFRHPKVLDNRMLFLKKNGPFCYRYGGPNSWWENQIKPEIIEIVKKPKNSWEKEEKKSFDHTLLTVLDSLYVQLNKEEDWIEIDEHDFNSIFAESSNPNPVLVFEKRRLSGATNKILGRTVSRQYLLFTVKGIDRESEELRVDNVDLPFFSEQIEVLKKLGVSKPADPLIRLTRSILVNGHYVEGFSDHIIKLKNGDQFTIGNTGYQKLRNLFPTLKT